MPAPLLMSAALAIAGEFFPALTAALRRPGGRALAESVVSAAAAAAGVSPASDPAQIIARVRENPAASEELRLELEQMNIDKELHLADLDDRDRARRAEISRGSDGRARGNWMIAGVTFGLISCVVAAVWGSENSINAGALTLLTTVAGALLKMLSDAFSYEFGSSRGSKEKTEDLMTMSRASQAETARAVESAQSQAASVAARVAEATRSAVTTGAATATAVAEQARKPRDFVGQLVRGEI